MGGVPGIRVAAAIPFLFVLPYIFAFYAVIYANSLPDWLSVSMTRHILLQASRTDRLDKFIGWLALDLISAVLWIVSTLILLVVAFALCREMIVLGGG